MSVKINSSSGVIEYDDDTIKWVADMIIDEQSRSVILLGTAHKLTSNERSDVITAILNKLAFGSYFNRRDYIYEYKLKNRNLEKKKEENDNSVDESLPMLAEIILELPKNSNECNQITYFRNIYNNIKLAVEEAISMNKYVIDDIDFEFFGSLVIFKRYKAILKHLIPIFKQELLKMSGRKIEIELITKYTFKKKTFSFRVKEV